MPLLSLAQFSGGGTGASPGGWENVGWLAGDSQGQQECLTGLWTLTAVKGNGF